MSIGSSHGPTAMDLLSDGTFTLPFAGIAVSALLVFVRRRGPRLTAAVLAAASNGSILVMRYGIGVSATGLDAFQYASAAIAVGMTLWFFAHRETAEPVDPRLRRIVRR